MNSIKISSEPFLFSKSKIPPIPVCDVEQTPHIEYAQFEDGKHGMIVVFSGPTGWAAKEIELSLSSEPQ